jgi:hypothetical protein
MWITMCVSNNLVLRLTRISNMLLPAGRLKRVPKRTTHPKAKHTKESHTLSIKINPKRSILLKVKLTGMPNRFSIKIDNFSMWTVMMRTSLRLIQPLHLQPHFLIFHNSKDLSQELVHAN